MSSILATCIVGDLWFLGFGTLWQTARRRSLFSANPVSLSPACLNEQSDAEGARSTAPSLAALLVKYKKKRTKKEAKMASPRTITIVALSFALGLFFVFMGTIKLTPRLSKDAYSEMVSYNCI